MVKTLADPRQLSGNEDVHEAKKEGLQENVVRSLKSEETVKWINYIHKRQLC